MRLLVSLLFLLAVSSNPKPLQSSKNLFEKISHEVMCQCGCNSLLSGCPMSECMVRSNMQSQIRRLIRQGKSENEILNSLAAVYGRSVLAAPPKSGFFLTAWIFPTIFLLMGSILLFLWLKNRSAASPLPPRSSHPSENKLLQKYLDELPD